MLISFIKLTKLFGENVEINDVDSLLKNDEVLFVGSLILKILKIIDKNVVRIHGDMRYSLSYDEECTSGYGIVPIGSLINHSCDPNITTELIGSSQAFIFYARTSIKKNSQVKT